MVRSSEELAVFVAEKFSAALLPPCFWVAVGQVPFIWPILGHEKWIKMDNS